MFIIYSRTVQYRVRYRCGIQKILTFFYKLINCTLVQAMASSFRNAANALIADIKRAIVTLGSRTGSSKRAIVGALGINADEAFLVAAALKLGTNQGTFSRSGNKWKVASPAGSRSQGSRSVAQRTLTIKIKAQSGDEIFYRIKNTTKFSNVFKHYAQAQGVERGSLSFKINLNGDNIDQEETPNSLHLEDGDEIHVFTIAQRTLTIRISNASGDELSFKIKNTTDFSKIIRRYAQRRGVEAEKLRFYLDDGERISPQLEFKTAEILGLEDGDVIVALKEQSGSIGIFGSHAKSLGIEYLTTDSYPSCQAASDLIRATKASLNATYLNQKQPNVLVKTQCDALMQWADEKWDGKSLDFKLLLSDIELTNLIGKRSFSQLRALMGGVHDTILLRRCMEHGKVIKFHTDCDSFQTLQVPLNTDYKGGCLVYVTKRGIEYPDRSAGSFTLHRNDILHGVTRLESGVRYGLFMLQKNE